MYFIIPLTVASAVLGLRHQIRNPLNSVLTRDSGACPGAPPFPSGAHPGDGCDGAPLSTRSPGVSRRGQMRKRQDTASCQVVTLAQYQTSPVKAGIEAIATKDWGDFNLVVNPPDPTAFLLAVPDPEHRGRNRRTLLGLILLGDFDNRTIPPPTATRSHNQRAAFLGFVPAQYKLGHAYSYAVLH
ncbi:hypothetical protein JB92DRAFT_3118575 [Gautieria morchelliformis]|nr:hypothetical protein JB92DRAFT_3118575 [Gautieria morchelliformis]